MGEDLVLTPSAALRAQELLKRVEDATEPDRELDAAIDVAMFGGETNWKVANYIMEQYPVSRRPNKNYIGGFANEHVPFVTASIDAALTLVAKKMPGAEYGLSTIYGIAHAELPLDAADGEHMCNARREDCNMPLAILEAFLRAFIAQAASATADSHAVAPTQEQEQK